MLGPALEAEIARIDCPRYKGGWFRYLLAGYDSVKGRLPPIDVPNLKFRDFDLIVLGTPIWTSYPAIPMRSFLSGAPDLPDRISLFLTFGGHSPPQKAEQFVSELLPVKLESTLNISQKTVADGTFSELVVKFAQDLGRNL